MNAPLAAEPGIQTYTAPRTVEDAARALAGGGATLIAGGTDLMTDPRAPWSDKPNLVNISRVDGMRGVTARDGKIEIGALTTVSDVLNSALLRNATPVLPATADRFASDQIRNMATLGGNIVNASPAGDMIVPLLLLDAEIDLVSWDGAALATRTVPLDGVFEGPGRSSIRGDELLTAIRFAEPKAGFTARFEKSGPRPALEVALVSAGVAGIKSGDTLSSVRVAFGSVAPTPIRCPKTEAALEGSRLDGAAIAAACDAAEAETAPISDVRGSDWYRGHLVRAYMESLLRDVAES
ncbi:MAG: FAD binding domain-containing protein [Alphaproteobacteria bacterium]